MPKNINSAFRLNQILTKAGGRPTSTTALKCWVSLLEIEEASDARQALRVNQKLGWLHKELEIVKIGMEKTDFSPALYASAFNRVENALSPLLLTQGWNNVMQFLSADVLIALSFCSEVLPDEENEINQEELTEIKAQVDQLQEMLDNSALPEGLKRLIEESIVLIKEALCRYPFSGAKALKEASQTAIGGLFKAGETAVAEVKATKEGMALFAIWSRINSVVDAAIKIDKLYQIGEKTYHLGAKVWDAIVS